MNYHVIQRPVPDEVKGWYEARLDASRISSELSAIAEFVSEIRGECKAYRLVAVDYANDCEISVLRYFFSDHRDAIEFKLRFL